MFRPCGSLSPGVFLEPLGLAFWANSNPNSPPGVSPNFIHSSHSRKRGRRRARQLAAHGGMRATHGGMRAAQRTLGILNVKGLEKE